MGGAHLFDVNPNTYAYVCLKVGFTPLGGEASGKPFLCDVCLDTPQYVHKNDKGGGISGVFGCKTTFTLCDCFYISPKYLKTFFLMPIKISCSEGDNDSDDTVVLWHSSYLLFCFIYNIFCGSDIIVVYVSIKYNPYKFLKSDRMLPINTCICSLRMT